MSKNSKIKDNLQFLNDYMFIPKRMKPVCTYHQLHFISRKDFIMFGENIICLSNACLIKEKGKTKLVYYNIDWIGNNILCDRKDGRIILKLSQTKNKSVLLAVERKIFLWLK